MVYRSIYDSKVQYSCPGVESGNKLAAGGEGTIYEIAGKPDLLAKIYFPSKLSSSPDLKYKLDYMIKHPPSDDVLNEIAWPRDIVCGSDGKFAGFIMRRLVMGKDLYLLYRYPPSDEYSGFSTQHRLIVALNICVVLEEMHRAGYVFGDFNDENVSVDLSEGHVSFVDADSYHFTDPVKNVTYRCGVIAPGYLAPEILRKQDAAKNAGRSDKLNDLPLPTFTKETDCFALAVHIFKLLMNGFSPFGGISVTARVSEASPGTGNEAIRRGNYCFKPGNKPQSQGVPDRQCMPGYIMGLFDRAFIAGERDPSVRPSASEWKSALKTYMAFMIQCSKDPLHFYERGAKYCPYCDARKRYEREISSAISEQSQYRTGSTGSGQYSFPSPVTILGSQPAVFQPVVPVAKPKPSARSSSGRYTLTTRTYPLPFWPYSYKTVVRSDWKELWLRRFFIYWGFLSVFHAVMFSVILALVIHLGSQDSIHPLDAVLGYIGPMVFPLFVVALLVSPFFARSGRPVHFCIVSVILTVLLFFLTIFLFPGSKIAETLEMVFYWMFFI